MALTNSQYMGIASGASNLLSSTVSGVNPVGDYSTQDYQNINDIGALANAAFNTQSSNNSYNSLGTMTGAAGAGATIGTSILPGVGTAIGAVGGALVGGVTSLFGKNKMKTLARQADKETAGNFANQAKLLESNSILNAQLNPMNSAAMGGSFPKLSSFNTGGTHGQNKYGGIPFGKSGDSINDAEEGETMLSTDSVSRIYSNRIKLKPSIVNLVGLDKNMIGKTPAEASKIINNKFIVDKVSGKDALLPMDKIRRNALSTKLDDIFMAQELSKPDKGTNTHMSMGGTMVRNTQNRWMVLNNIVSPFEYGGIHIKDSKKGTFTAAATKHNLGVQEFASRVLANKENYSPSMVKKAVFAKNASKWHHARGVEIPKVTYDASKINSQALSGLTNYIPNKLNSNNPLPQIINPSVQSPASTSNIASYLKYAPVLGNILQTIQLSSQKPEVVKYPRISIPARPKELGYRDIDTRPYIQQLEKAQRTSTGLIREASAGNRAQYLANTLGSDLGYISKAGELQNTLNKANFDRRLATISANNAALSNYQQLLANVEQVNANIGIAESDANAKNRAALSNLRNQGMQSIFSNLGTIGSEQESINSILKAYGINPITFKRP